MPPQFFIYISSPTLAINAPNPLGQFRGKILFFKEHSLHPRKRYITNQSVYGNHSSRSNAHLSYTYRHILQTAQRNRYGRQNLSIERSSKKKLLKKISIHLKEEEKKKNLKTNSPQSLLLFQPLDTQVRFFHYNEPLLQFFETFFLL